MVVQEKMKVKQRKAFCDNGFSTLSWFRQIYKMQNSLLHVCDFYNIITIVTPGGILGLRGVEPISIPREI